MFLPVSLSKSKFFTRVALMSFVQHSCRTCVARVSLVSLVSHSCCIRVARVWHSCCKLDQIYLKHTMKLSFFKEIIGSFKYIVAKISTFNLLIFNYLHLSLGIFVCIQRFDKFDNFSRMNYIETLSFYFAMLGGFSKFLSAF